MRIKLHPDVERLSVDALAQIVDSQHERLQHTQRERLDAARELLGPELTMVALSILATTELVNYGRELWSEERRVLWLEMDPTTPKVEALFEDMLVNSANTVAAIELLSVAGYETPSRTVVRRLVELTELFLATLFDFQTLRHYADKSEDFNSIYATWRKHLSPGVIRRVLQRYYQDVGLTNDEIEDQRTSSDYDQRWLSLASHNYFLSLAIEAEHTDVSVDQRFEFILDPTHYLSAAATLRKACEVQSNFLLVVQHVLLTKHGWKFEGPAANRFMYYRALFASARRFCYDKADEDEKLTQSGSDEER